MNCCCCYVIHVGESKEKRNETLKSHDYSLCTGETSKLTEGTQFQNCVIFLVYHYENL